VSVGSRVSIWVGAWGLQRRSDALVVLELMDVGPPWRAEDVERIATMHAAARKVRDPGRHPMLSILVPALLLRLSAPWNPPSLTETMMLISGLVLSLLGRNSTGEGLAMRPPCSKRSRTQLATGQPRWNR
jgi:hypothetical protein